MKYIAACLLSASLQFFVTAKSQPIPYNYKDVKIGGGGFVSGLVFNPAEKDLLYARTDVGGAYRWESGLKKWQPLTDFLGQDEENYSGILSLAADPSDANRVYMATGLYTQWWAGNAAVFASADKGNTWSKSDLGIKLGGNEDGRSTGERLAVDPNKGSILYLGSSKDGLWKSTDYAATWNKVNSFPIATFSGAGVSFVIFDKTSAATGNATQTIYVGVLQTGNNLYKSTDGGATWSAVPNQPASLMPLQAVLTTNGTLYISYSDAPGPNGISTGAVYKLNTATNAFTAINPPGGQGGFAGISVAANDPNTVVVSTIDRWWPGDELYRSTDAGLSWKPLFTNATWDHSIAPYANGYKPHWMGDVELDPFDANNAWFITGYGVYQSQNVGDASASKPVAWTFSNDGLEETVVLSLISPPSGVPLLSAVGDLDGYRHADLNASPSAGRYQPNYNTNSSLAFAQANANYVARTYPNSSGNYGSYSTDQGVTWTKFGAFPPGTNGAGNIAVSANAATLVWSNQGAAGAYYSVNNGISWQASTGIATGLPIVADRVNSNKFYSYDATAGVCISSNNGGASFANAATGLPTLQSWELWMSSTATVFGAEGDVWITSGYNGLYHSTNSGASFTKINGVGAANKVAFGKAAAGATYPTIFIAGKIDGVYGFYRSVDAGVSWNRVNDYQHQFLSIRAFAADPNVFGRFYIGTSGRGIIYGEDETTLPIKLSAFTGQLVNSNQTMTARLGWKAVADPNSSHFDIERSTDGSTWKKIGTVAARQTSALSDYSFDDALNGTGDKWFYRLKIVGKDGGFVYSGIIPLSQALNQSFTASVSPNPLVGNSLMVSISTKKAAGLVVKICALNGAVVYSTQQQVAAGVTLFQVYDMPVLAKGLYLLQLYSRDSKERLASVKFVKE